MPRKAAKKTAKKRATSRKRKPSVKHHVPPAPLPRRKVDGVWRWYTHGMQPIKALTAAERDEYGLKND